MTDDQYALCHLLHRCRYLPGSYEKRFARDIQAKAPDDALTARQAAQLLRQAHRYRNQLQALIGAHVHDPTIQRRLRLQCLLGHWEDERPFSVPTQEPQGLLFPEEGPHG